jgi:hypothetical protein
MENLILKSFRVHEIDPAGLKEIDGGGIFRDLGYLVGIFAAAYEEFAIENPEYVASSRCFAH